MHVSSSPVEMPPVAVVTCDIESGELVRVTVGEYVVSRSGRGWRLSGPSYTGMRRNYPDAVSGAYWWHHQDNKPENCGCLDCYWVKRYGSR